MNKEQVDLLGEYIKAGKSAVLIEEIPESVIEKGAVVINSDCSSSELMGHYDNLEYVAPEWYGKLIESSKTHTPVLIIKDVHKLPENCMIFVTYSDLKENPIEEEIYSFMAHI